MRAISEEMRSGSFEILQTLPLSSAQIIIGKYIGVVFIIFIALFPTIIYAVSMQSLSITGGIDMGATIGSYISLFFLASVYAAIGIFASSLVKNMIAAFALGAFLCFVLFIGLDAISQLPFFSSGTDYYIQLFGIKMHTANMSRGVIDIRDLIYFIAMAALFLYFTKIQISKQYINR
jgi:ABC-2 type transport system permease protein